VVSYRRRNCSSIQLEIAGKHLIEPCDIADDFSKYFQSVYNNPCLVVFPTYSSSSEFLSSAFVSYLDVFIVSKHLRPSKSVGLDDIPGFLT
jgi:hypothetical protein